MAGSFDLLCVQECPRRDSGWGEHETDCFMWFSHRDPSQWRGVGVGISRDLFDSITDKIACSRGAAWVVRLRGHRRIILCSLHCPTGVTVGRYHQDVQDFKHVLRKWHPDLPVFGGVDVNEELGWSSEDSSEACVRSGAKVDKLLEGVASLRLRAVPPRIPDRRIPTHYPRDESRDGRHIDAVFVRLLGGGPVVLHPDKRFEINTDHALLEMQIELQRTRPNTWIDSRPRWVVCDSPLPPVDDFGDVQTLAATHCKPRTRKAYRDDDETKELIFQAKTAPVCRRKGLWKLVHRMRRRKKRQWQQQRLTNILNGNWEEYRDHQARIKKRSWWGGMLSGKGSQAVAEEVQSHLEGKLWDVARNWDSDLQARLDRLPVNDAILVPIDITEIQTALAGMKARSSVGDDKIGVDLLRRLAAEQPEELSGMCTTVLVDGILPEPWGVSLLALIPKCQNPVCAGDLRPIAMGSAAMKMMSRIIMNRTFGFLRSPSCCAASGRGRQAADLIGTFTRLRDVCREWREGIVAIKLDVKGAFDFIDRGRVADYLEQRLAEAETTYELRFLLLLLAENVLRGAAPGGGVVTIQSNRGIKQGSPEICRALWDDRRPRTAVPPTLSPVEGSLTWTSRCPCRRGMLPG